MFSKLLFVYSCLCLTAFGAESGNNNSSTNFLTNLMGSFRSPNAINLTQFLSTFQMPACMKECLPELNGLLNALSKTNDTRDLSTICSELQSSTRCASSAGCSKLFTDAAASAFQFVCLDNIQAISESMECVKKTAMDVQDECEAHCEVQSRIIDEASNKSVTVDLELPRVCNSTRCLLTCFKNKIDSKCRIGQRTLLDSVLSALMRGEDNGFENALDWIMPSSCQRKTPSNSSVQLSVGKVAHASTTIKPSKKDDQNSTKGNRVSADNSQSKTKTVNDKSEPVTIRLPPAQKTPENIDQPVEVALIIDGEIRTLRYQLFDWQGNPVQSPDFRTLAKIMTLQLLPFKFPSGRPRETIILPSEDDEKAAERRLEEKIAIEKIEDGGDGWRSENGPEVTSDFSNDGVGVAVGLIIFAATVFYWIWEVAQDLR